VTRTATQITCTTGAHAAALVDVVVTNTDSGTVTKSNAYTYVPPSVVNPTITTVSPSSGPIAGGTTVTITGTGFQAGATVLIGGVACTVVTRTATQITCTTGAHAAGLTDVVVTNTDTGTVTKSNAYTYVAPGVVNPTITTVSPSSGPIAGGTTLTINGTGFQAGATVLVGGVACTVVTRTATKITCTTGARAAALVNVVVTNTDSGTATKANAFRYVAPAAPGTHTIKKTVYFGSSSYLMTAKATKTLAEYAARVPAGATIVKIKITGFVQPSPDKANDGILSLARAKSVKYALKKLGFTGPWIVSGEGRATGDPVLARRATIELTYRVVA
jgi:outer membrane protein OmpA-like peptidoglycan-associated protein